MEKLICSYYGYECDFVAEGEIEDVIQKFKTHTDNEHGKDQSKESLMQFIIRQNQVMKKESRKHQSDT